jgi:hypothetical protein
MTRGVADRVAQDAIFAIFCMRSLKRHAAGDWGGGLCAADKALNDLAVKDGESRIFSAYEEKGLPRIWIVTEANRAATTTLFPSEY